MHADRDDEGLISGINVTPLVDVVLVLLLILMVTASYIVSKTIPMDLPRAATGEVVVTTLAVSVDRAGQTYLDGQAVSPSELRLRIRLAKRTAADTRAVLAADGDTRHQAVVAAIDLLRQEGISKFAINVRPEDLVDDDGR